MGYSWVTWSGCQCLFAELEWSLGTAKSKEEMEESGAEVCAFLWAESQHQAETLYKCRRS